MILDAETAAFIEVATRIEPMQLLTPGVANPIEQWVRGRIEWMEAGIARCPGWFAKTLARFDKTLRVRWDSYKDHWVVERLGPNTGVYHRVGTWDRPLGFPLIDALQKGDMWQSTTTEKVAEVEAAAEKQRQINDQKTRDGYAEQVDLLTNRQVRDFVEISEAIAHGDSITAAGPDADFLNRVHAENVELEKRGLLVIPQDLPINPGMGPRKAK